MDDLFTPPTENWQRIAANYAALKRLMVLITWSILTVLVALPVGIFVVWWAGLIVVAVAIPWVSWRYLRQAKLAATWGYAERDNDLYVTHGLWFKNLTIVPYGRLQVAEVNSGPLLRKYGMANVQITTSASSVTIPGLTTEAAAALRDRLSDLSLDRQAGL